MSFDRPDRVVTLPVQCKGMISAYPRRSRIADPGVRDGPTYCNLRGPVTARYNDSGMDTAIPEGRPNKRFMRYVRPPMNDKSNLLSHRSRLDEPGADGVAGQRQRSRMPSFCRMLARCRSTVFALITRVLGDLRDEWPSAMSLTISSSRGVRMLSGSGRPPARCR